MRKGLLIGLLLLAGPAVAQVPAPAAGTGGGGPVGSIGTQPTHPQGWTPPGTPSGQTSADRQARDAAGQAVIGKTATPPSAVPGNTGGVQSGTRQ